MGSRIWKVVENKLLPWILAGGMLWFGATRADQTTNILLEMLAQERAENTDIREVVEDLRQTIEQRGFVLPPTSGPALP